MALSGFEDHQINWFMAQYANVYAGTKPLRQTLQHSIRTH